VESISKSGRLRNPRAKERMERNRAMNRRALLAAMGFIVTGGTARAAIRPPPASRRLKLYNAHTKETFDGPYRGPDGVIDSAVAELSQLLRDFHSGVVVPMDIGVIDFLWNVLHAVGATDATILSAYRTPETNATLARTTFGVAEHSQHMYARAIDFTIGSRLEEAMTAARALKQGGVGWYPQSHFIHVDSGPVRNWDLGDANLQQLLNNSAEPNGRTAARRGATRAQPPASQYASQGTSDSVIRPSVYSAPGSKNVAIRPSQYGGDP
jgi:uncharacterized protein YcbK (DUF882 family)